MASKYLRGLTKGEIDANRDSLRVLKAAHQDPKDLAQRVAKYQLWLARKRAGKLPMMEGVLKYGRRD